MSISVSQHTPEFCTAGQLQPEDMAALAAHGIRTVINNRPDGEGGPDQPLSDAIGTAVRGSAVIVIVMSENYLAEDSEWCQRELEAFVQRLAGPPAPAAVFSWCARNRFTRRAGPQNSSS